jgi:hypothetical protein
MVGYSGTSLARKLGYTDGMPVFVASMPPSVREEIERQAAPAFTDALDAGVFAAHLFVSEQADLDAHLTRLRHTIAPDGMVWVSWPKQSAKVPTDLTENVVRESALPLGFVDVKVCAVDQVWSGLKLVIRKELRDPARR